MGVFLVKKGVTVTVPIFITDITDHIAGMPGLTPTITIAKNGGGFGAIHQTSPVAEVGGSGNGDGHYYVTLDDVDTDTLGSLILHYPGDASSDPADEYIQVVAFDPNSATVQARIADSGVLGF